MIKYSLCFISILLILFASSSYLIADSESFDEDRQSESLDYFSSETKCWAKGAELLDAGNYDDALTFLETALKKYANSEIILSLYGEVLFRTHKLKEAEDQFRKVLDENPYNEQAKQRIEDIRSTEKLMESREIAELKAFGKDVTSKILMLVIGVWFGSLLTLLSEKIFNYFKRSNLQKALNSKNYKMAMDILEEQVNGNQKRELSNSISKLIQHFGIKDDILIAIDKLMLCINAFNDDSSVASKITGQTRGVLIQYFIQNLNDYINKNHHKNRSEFFLIKVYHYIYFVIAAFCDGHIKALEFCIMQSMQIRFNLDNIDDQQKAAIKEHLKIENIGEKTILKSKANLLKIIQEHVQNDEDQIKLMETSLFTFIIDGTVTYKELQLIDEIKGDWTIGKWKNDLYKKFEEVASINVNFIEPHRTVLNNI